MNQLKTDPEAAEELPVTHDGAGFVCGAGPAGLAAAVTAGRQGQTTMLLEQTGMVGGIATAGLMSHWTGASEGPLLDELLERANKLERDDPAHISCSKNIIHPENLKLVMLQMLQEAGVKVRLYTFAADVIMTGRQVNGVIAESKSGREAITAAVVIDATGDGDIAFKAGAAFHKGREADGRMQPVTVMFKLGGVSAEHGELPGSFEAAPELQALAQKALPHPAGHVLLYKSSLPGVITVNMTNAIDIDGTSAADLTRGEIICRQQIPLIVKFLRENVAGFANAYVIATSSLLGVRETRHFKGLYTVTAEDILTAREFPDWLAPRCHFNFDIHNLDGAGLDAAGAQHKFRQKKQYALPYGAFVPEKIDGLLLAGRNISGTHKAHSNFRVMPICVNMGQGVGTAAALAAKKGVLPRELPVAEIQENLRQQGVSP